MTKGKPWKVEEERQLRELVKSGHGLDSIAKALGRTADAVYLKCHRLGLRLEEVGGSVETTTSSLKLPKELPSVEEALKMLAGAMEKACEPGLGRVEVQRLQVMATLARTYENILARYLDYRGHEKRLGELEEEIAEIQAVRKGNAAN